MYNVLLMSILVPSLIGIAELVQAIVTWDELFKSFFWIEVFSLRSFTLTQAYGDA